MGIRVQAVKDIKPQCGYCNDKFKGICPLIRMPINCVNRAIARKCIKQVRKSAKR